MSKKVYPLQDEIQKDLIESAKFVFDEKINTDPITRYIAERYYRAITRINDICVNRKRF